MSLAIRSEGLTRRFGKRTAVDGVDLAVRPGTITGFLGPNGAGKTTTISLLLGLQTAQAGNCDVLGRPPGHPEALAQIGALVEAPSLYDHLTGLENPGDHPADARGAPLRPGPGAEAGGHGAGCPPPRAGVFPGHAPAPGHGPGPAGRAPAAHPGRARQRPRSLNVAALDRLPVAERSQVFERMTVAEKTQALERMPLDQRATFFDRLSVAEKSFIYGRISAEQRVALEGRVQ